MKRKKLHLRYHFIRLIAFLIFIGMGFVAQHLIAKAICKYNPVRKYALGLMLNGIKAKIGGILK